MVQDYDKTLYHMLWGNWEDLLPIMVDTNDDLLSKQIKQFLTSLNRLDDDKDLQYKHDRLLNYVDHAME